MPDNDPAGLTVTGTVNLPAGSVVLDLSISLNITGNFNGDLYAYLQKDGVQSILLNRVGRSEVNPFGYVDAGFDVTFSDSAASDIHFYNPSVTLRTTALTGTWQPDGRTISPTAAPFLFDEATRTSLLGNFDDLNPSGTWTLVIKDYSGGGLSKLNGWKLDILSVVPVPEPTTFGLLGCGACALVLIGRRARP